MEPLAAIGLTENIISNDIRHQDYERTVKVAKWARAIVTGKGQDDMVTRFRKRESEELKKQRIEQYSPLTPVPSGQVMSIYGKVRRTDGIKEVISHPVSETEAEVKRVISRFFANGHLSEYLYDKSLYYNFIDPNAFLIVEKEMTFDREGVVTNVNSYPFEVRSDQVVNYEYKNGLLQWLMIDQKRTEVVNGVNVTLSDYYFYTAGITLHYQEYSEDQAAPELEGYERVTLGDTDTRFFVWRLYETGTTETPAIRFGVYLDPQTDGRTCITPLHFAEYVYQDLIEDKSLFDLTKKLHTFPQKYFYAPICEYERDGLTRCDSGFCYDHKQEKHIECPSCHGTGLAYHTTEQQGIGLAMPQNKEEFVSLSELAHYVQLPDWLPRWYTEQLNELCNRIMTAIFSDELQKSDNMTETATAHLLNLDKIYDRLEPFSTGISAMYEKAVRVTGQYLGVNQLEVSHKFPTDYGMENERQLFEKLRLAIDSNAPAGVVDAIKRQILKKTYKNTPEQVDRILAYDRWKPFKNHPPEMISMILMDRSPSDFDRVLYENFSRIIELTEEATANLFHRMNYEMQREQLQRSVEQALEGIQYKTQPEPLPGPFGGGDE